MINEIIKKVLQQSANEDFAFLLLTDTAESSHWVNIFVFKKNVQSPSFLVKIRRTNVVRGFSLAQQSEPKGSHYQKIPLFVGQIAEHQVIVEKLYG